MSGSVDVRNAVGKAADVAVDRLEVVVSPGEVREDPASPTVRPAGSRLRRWRRSRRDQPREEREAQNRTAVIDLDIDPGDPVLAVLQAAAGTVEVRALPAWSPAVRLMKEKGVELVVPLVASGELVGLMVLGPRLSERGYSREDRRLLDDLARYAAPALRLGQLIRQQEEEARDLQRIEQELQVAQLIQQQFLPRELPDLQGWHVAAFYRPARTIGGDFYDVMPLPDGRIMLVEGDVTDKGVPAALVMASTHALLRSTAADGGSPGEVLAKVNDLLHPQIPAHMFVTCLVLFLDTATGHVVFANAGHNLPYLRRGDDLVELMARGMPLGLMPGSRYDEHEARIHPGDVVLLYSDGLTEQHDAAGEMFGFARTKELVAHAESADQLVGRCVSELTRHSGDMEQEDDITLVAIERRNGAGFRKHVSFDVPSVSGNERVAMDRVAAVVGDALPPARLDALKTAVSETIMNAIEHGNAEREDVPVTVTVAVAAAAVTVEIADRGRGREAPTETPDIELKLAGLQSPRGWGMFLIRSLVDSVEEEVGDARHIVRLVMSTAPEPGATPALEGGTP